MCLSRGHLVTSCVALMALSVRRWPRKRGVLAWHRFCSQDLESTNPVPVSSPTEGESRMQVKELMSTTVEVVERNDDLSRVEDLMVAKKLRHVPVLENGELVAVVSQRDLFKAM